MDKIFRRRKDGNFYFGAFGDPDDPFNSDFLSAVEDGKVEVERDGEGHLVTIRLTPKFFEWAEILGKGMRCARVALEARRLNRKHPTRLAESQDSKRKELQGWLVEFLKNVPGYRRCRLQTVWDEREVLWKPGDVPHYKVLVFFRHAVDGARKRLFEGTAEQIKGAVVTAFEEKRLHLAAAG